MAALAYAGSPSLPALYVLTFLVGLGHSVFWPSITALLQEVIRPDQLTEASGLAEITWQVGNLTGAALGGPILIAFGLGTAFAIDAATYAVSAAALLALHHRPAPVPRGRTRRGSRWRGTGLPTCARHPAIAGFGIASVIPWVATISLNVVIVAYVLDVLHLSATAYGLADMTYGVGAMASGVFAALLVARLGEWRAMTGVMVALIACYTALAVTPGRRPVFYAVLFFAGFCSSGVPGDDHGVPVQGRPERGDGPHVLVVPARVDGAPGRRDALGRAARQPTRARAAGSCSWRRSSPSGWRSWLAVSAALRRVPTVAAETA